MTENLTARTLRGTSWSLSSTIVNATLQIVLTAVLARLVLPSAFGLIAMAGLALRFGQYFAQMGLGQALVQTRVVDTDDVAATFTGSLALGAVFSAAFWVLAPAVAVVFRTPALMPVVRVLGIGRIFAGAGTAALSLLRRELRFKAIAVVDVVAYGVGYGLVGVVLAWRGAGVWSLVAASLCQTFLSSAGYYAASRHPLRLAFRWSAYRRLSGFGSRVSIIGFLEFIGSSLDTFAVGRVLGDATPRLLQSRSESGQSAHPVPEYEPVKGPVSLTGPSPGREGATSESLPRNGVESSAQWQFQSPLG